MGTRVTRAAPHFPVEEVKERMKREPRFWVRQRWWIIYNALIAPRKAEEIAKHTGVSVPTVRRVISGYNRLGLAALETPGKGGRRHEFGSLGSQPPPRRSQHGSAVVEPACSPATSRSRSRRISCRPCSRTVHCAWCPERTGRRPRRRSSRPCSATG